LSLNKICISLAGFPERNHAAADRAGFGKANDMVITLVATCLAILVASVLGGIIPLATVLNHTRLQVYLSFSAGTMLGAAFFHMMPEAVRVGSAATIPWAAAGLLMLFFLERFFSFHHHESQDDGSERHPSCDHQKPHDHSSHMQTGKSSEGKSHSGDTFKWPSAAFGLAVHSLVGGVALASAVAADFQEHGALGAAGLGVLLATLVHKPADALTISTLMVRGGSAHWLVHLVNFGFGLMIPAGVALFVMGSSGFAPGAASSITAGALSFSAGTFLCIALSDLLPELQFHSHDRLKLSMALLAGVMLMGVTAVFSAS
jgi:zinc and cadmium transporter